MPERALTLKQPWAWLIIHGCKNIENRPWNTRFRGRFYVHTSKEHHKVDYDRALQLCNEMGVELPPYGSSVYQCGGIIGAATIVTVLPREDVLAWKFQGQYGFVLGYRQPTNFIPCKGALNFWRVPEHIESQILPP